MLVVRMLLGQVTSPIKETVGVLPSHSPSHPASPPVWPWQLKQLPLLGKHLVYNATISLTLPIPHHSLTSYHFLDERMATVA